MNARLPRQLEIQADLAFALFEAAVKAARAAANHDRRRPRRGETLKPGTETPLWNVLAAQVAAQLKVRGERVRLARVLGLPRQRVTEMLRSRRTMPDGERTLMLLVWLDARRRGYDLACI